MWQTAVRFLLIWFGISAILAFIVTCITLLIIFDIRQGMGGDVGYLYDVGRRLADYLNDYRLLILAAVTGLGAVLANDWVYRFDVAREELKQVVNEQMQALNKSTSMTAYASLDDFYKHLLTLAIQYPHLRDATKLPDPLSVELDVEYQPLPTDASKDQKMQYDAYAFMLWNFLETVHDRCQDNPDILNTWATVVSAENSIHRGWFLKQMAAELDAKVAAKNEGKPYSGSHKFCKDFQIFIYNGNFKQTPRTAEYSQKDKDLGIHPDAADFANWSYFMDDPAWVGKEKGKREEKREFLPRPQKDGVYLWD